MARVFIRPQHTSEHGRKEITELLSDTTRWHIPMEDSALTLFLPSVFREKGVF